jgi:hypothetical protein
LIIGLPTIILVREWLEIGKVLQNIAVIIVDDNIVNCRLSIFLFVGFIAAN